MRTWLLVCLVASCAPRLSEGQFGCNKDVVGSCPSGWLCQCRGADCEYRCYAQSAGYCGDGERQDAEECDGTQFRPDACASGGFPICAADCHVYCTVCGNGVVELTADGRGEECDDGNLDSGDGCSSKCQLERCGNGVVDPNEACDDGNNIDRDGCSADCRSDEGCGNGVVDVTIGESCDDGNRIDGDGCEANCRLPSCGNGVVDKYEGCDEGAANSDAPDATCRTNCRPRRCGDAILDSDERCDDGNAVAGDGCSPDCESDETCGNGYIDAVHGEECDDGNHVNGDGCQANCKLPVCGDGITDSGLGETCDSGNANSDAPDAACRTNCRSRRCGDGVVDTLAGEICDDANSSVGDGCTPDCLSTEICGNHYVDFVAGELCDDGGRQSHDGCASQCQLEAPTWTEWRNDMMPSPGRQGTRLAYDAARERMVLFGGLLFQSGVGFSRLEDTWEWDGVRWSSVNVSGPAARSEYGMVFDAARQVTFLFGGQNGALAYGDSWEYDGNRWSELHPPLSPAKRSSPAMAYDSSRQRIVLFGGNDGSLLEWLGDTWEWDGAAWTNVSPAGPSPTPGSYAAAYDPARGKTLLFGGTNGPNAVNDTWEWDGAVWTKVNPAGPTPPPAANLMTYDARRQQVVLLATDTWEWDGSNWSKRATGGPGAISLAYDLAHHEAVSFGSGPFPQNNETQLWDGTSWSLATPSPIPEPRYQHMMAYDADRHQVVLFGGQRGFNPYNLGDTWTWDASGWHNVTPSDPSKSPTARAVGMMTYDAKRKQIVLVGGEGNTTATQHETWVWDGTQWQQKAALPYERSRAGIAYDSFRERVVVFGNSSDTWEWDGSSWATVTPPDPNDSPPDRADLAMAYDPIRRRTVMFGGGLRNDTWEWDGAKWTNVTPAISPRGRKNHTMVFDRARGKVLLFGGETNAFDSGYLDDLWEWDGQKWTQLFTAQLPHGRASHAAAYDDALRMMVVFAGNWVSAGASGQTILGDTWTFRFQGTVSDETCLGFDPDRDGLVGCADPDCGGVCGSCGDAVCSAGESCRLCPSDCGTCALCGDFFCDAGETHASCPGDCP